ncbi:hypothetical protein PESP_a2464 [Pseudoalteromonas espejiana DSM 9414]|nr:hypothetical protein PESP_a2464 [Pseudoalteromonas espejiana DSM 9414]
MTKCSYKLKKCNSLLLISCCKIILNFLYIVMATVNKRTF